MSRGYWIAAIAAGLVAALSSPVCGQQEAENTRQGAASTNQGITDQSPWSVPVNIVEDKAEAKARQGREQRSEQRELEDLAAQQGMNEATQKMADYALYQTFLVFAGTILLGYTLYLTREANRAAAIGAKAAQDTVAVTQAVGRAQARAYLTIESANFDIDALSVHVTLGIKNVGQSPSQRCRVSARFRMVDPFSKPAGIKYIYASEEISSECGVIPVGVTEDIDIIWVWSFVTDDKKRYDYLVDENLYFDIGCKIEWIDIFDGEQNFHFFLDGFRNGSDLVKGGKFRKRMGKMKVSSILFGTKSIDETRAEIDKRNAEKP